MTPQGKKKKNSREFQEQVFTLKHRFLLRSFWYLPFGEFWATFQLRPSFLRLWSLRTLAECYRNRQKNNLPAGPHVYASSHTVSYFEASTETSHVAFLQTHLKAPPLSKQKVSVTTEITDASSTKMHTVSPIALVQYSSIPPCSKIVAFSWSVWELDHLLLHSDKNDTHIPAKN